MKKLIKLNDCDGGLVLINPRHIVGVTTYHLKPKAKARVICLVGEYQVIETQEQIQDLVNGKSKSTSWKPKENETYYFYDIMNDLKKISVFVNKEPHISRVKIGNCFKTLEDVDFDLIIKLN